MNSYRFRNLNIRHEGLDFLTNGLAFYKVEDYEEDGKQAAFETAELYDALGHLADTVVRTLNEDNHLTRILGSKI